MTVDKTLKLKKLRVALVDDILTVDGGAQRILRVLHDMWPEAPVYCNTYFPERFNPPLDGWDIRKTWVSRLPFNRMFEQQYKLFYPSAFEMLDFSQFDLVLSMTYAGYSKGIIVPPNCVHICYVMTVPRYLWGYRTSIHERVGGLYKGLILPILEHYWRIWDRQSAMRPKALMANSQNIARRIQKHWQRDSFVLYPPANIETLLKKQPKKEDHFIYFGRLEKYKCVDMAIRSCVNASEKLKIVGTGSYEKELKDLVAELGADRLVEFSGWKRGEPLEEEIARAKGFIFPGPDEDFGLVMVESLAAGTPVIAFDAGGAAEIVEDGRTGTLVKEFSQQALDKAVRNYSASDFDQNTCRERSKQFSVDVFKEKLLTFLYTQI